jgi:hypothetical protein
MSIKMNSITRLQFAPTVERKTGDTRIQMGVISKVVSVVFVVKLSHKNDSLYLLYPILLEITKFLASYQTVTRHSSYASSVSGLVVCCLINVASATSTGSAVCTLCRLLWISFWPGSHEWAPILVVCCLINVASATSTGSSVDTLFRLLWISFWPGSHESAPILVVCLFTNVLSATSTGRAVDTLCRLFWSLSGLYLSNERLY